MWARGTTQLRTWELKDIEEDEAHAERLDGASATRRSVSGLVTPGTHQHAESPMKEKYSGTSGPRINSGPAAEWETQLELALAGLPDLVVPNNDADDKKKSEAEGEGASSPENAVIEEQSEIPHDQSIPPLDIQTLIADVGLKLKAEASLASPLALTSGPTMTAPIPSESGSPLGAFKITPPPLDPSNTRSSPLDPPFPARLPARAAPHIASPAPRPFAPATPPMFGPERAVLDPRIRAVHRQVMMDLLRSGTVCSVLFMLLVVCVPSRG